MTDRENLLSCSLITRQDLVAVPVFAYVRDLENGEGR